MRRREFITFVGAAAAWPLAARAHSGNGPRRVGVLMNGAPADPQLADFVAAFEQILRTLGWKLGQNLSIEYRWGNADAERIKSLAVEIVGLTPDLIVANTTTCLIAIRKTSTTIPVVFLNVSDPVAQGFVSNIAHPEGNATGFAGYEFSIGSKWVGLLKQLVPSISHVAMMFNPVAREFSQVGGLISYGASSLDAYRQAGRYVGRSLKGERPGDLPVLQPTRFELVINLKTAKALGLEIPPTLLALADEVIE